MIVPGECKMSREANQEAGLGMSWHRAMMVLGAAALLVALTQPAMAWDPKVNGYSQFRYEYSDSEGDGDFDTRRVRLNWKDTVNDEGTTFRIQLDFSDLLTGDGQSVSPKDIWVMQPWANGWSTLVGYTTVMFGYELEYSSSKRLPFERSRAARSFFPGERALGAAVTYAAPDSAGVVFDLEYVDGMDAWDRDGVDDVESVIANVELPFGDGNVAGLSYMTSRIDLAPGGVQVAQDGSRGASLSPQVWGLHLAMSHAIGTAGDLALQAEYYDGDWYDHRAYEVYSADGWYAQLAFSPEDAELTPFYRYDEFSYVPADGGSSDYTRHTLGVAYEPMENNRLTLQIEDIEDRGSDDTTVGLQWQVSYK